MGFLNVEKAHGCRKRMGYLYVIMIDGLFCYPTERSLNGVRDGAGEAVRVRRF